MTATSRRVQVPITEDVQVLLSALRDPDIGASPDIRQLLGEVPSSDAGILARLVSLGAERVREAQRVAGYAALAQSMNAPEERAYGEAAKVHRRRQAAAWADA